MADLLKIAVALIQSNAARAGRQVLEQRMRVAVATLAAVVFGGAALACALAALWIALPPYVGAAGAPLVVSGVLLLFCFAALIAGRARPKARPPEPVIPAELLESSLEQFKTHKGAVLLAALLAGLAAGGCGK